MARRKAAVAATDTAIDDAPHADSAFAEAPEAPIPTAELAPDTNVTPKGATPDAEPEKAEKKWADIPDPRGIQSIDLGDGRRARLLRGSQFQQAGISLYSNDESVDPKPSPEETQWLKDHGFTTYRPEQKARTRQLIAPEQKAEIEEERQEHGDQAANRLRSKFRVAGQLAAEQDFVEFVNGIRQKNGKEPIEAISTEQGKTPF